MLEESVETSADNENIYLLIGRWRRRRAQTFTISLIDRTHASLRVSHVPLEDDDDLKFFVQWSNDKILRREAVCRQRLTALNKTSGCWRGTHVRFSLPDCWVLLESKAHENLLAPQPKMVPPSWQYYRHGGYGIGYID